MDRRHRLPGRCGDSPPEPTGVSPTVFFLKESQLMEQCMPVPELHSLVFFGLLGVLGCAACAGRTVPTQLTAPLPTAAERAVILQEAWQTILREQEARAG